MTFHQQIHDCADHDGCHNIICVDDSTGDVVWESHDANTTDPAARVNPDYPAFDHTGAGDPVPVVPTAR